MAPPDRATRSSSQDHPGEWLDAILGDLWNTASPRNTLSESNCWMCAGIREKGQHSP